MKFANWLLAGCACVGSVTAATPAAAIQYFMGFPIGAGSVLGSITTDNMLGVLTTANITAFSLFLNDSTSTLLIDNSNADVRISGNSLTATASGLFFDFSGPASGFALFQSPAIGSGRRFVCVQTSGCFDFSGSGAAVDVDSRFPGQVVRLSGVQQIGVAAPASVPEPATWGLMLVGFGAMGHAMRRRRRVAVSFS